jgi:hypothetical protein
MRFKRVKTAFASGSLKRAFRLLFPPVAPASQLLAISQSTVREAEKVNKAPIPSVYKVYLYQASTYVDTVYVPRLRVGYTSIPTIYYDRLAKRKVRPRRAHFLFLFPSVAYSFRNCVALAGFLAPSSRPPARSCKHTQSLSARYAMKESH